MRGGQHINELEVLLEKFGAETQVKSTIERIKKKDNWDNFLHDYPYGTHINPHAIKQIVTNYYNTKKDGPTNDEEKPTYIKKNPTFNSLSHDARINY